MTDQAERLAAQMWRVARSQEQCTRAIADDGTAEAVRARIRRAARAEGIKIRTARIGDRVVVVRLDAQVWNQDTATMRSTLLPSEP